MTEYTITRANAAHDLKAIQLAISLADDAGAGITSASLQELADSIEAQVKPSIEEPTEWGSVVRARRVGYGAEDTTTLRWQRQDTQDASDSWSSEPAGDLGIRYKSHWSYLNDPEVLRVGVGPQPLAEWESDLLNFQYRRDTAAAVLMAMDVDQCLIDAVVNAKPDAV